MGVMPKTNDCGDRSPTETKVFLKTPDSSTCFVVLTITIKNLGLFSIYYIRYKSYLKIRALTVDRTTDKIIDI
jgi:hypothetical protein